MSDKLKRALELVDDLDCLLELMLNDSDKKYNRVSSECALMEVKEFREKYNIKDWRQGNDEIS